MIKLMIDNFAGGGGASEGIKQATGRDVDIAINHDGSALIMHKANHPDTLHLIEDVFDVDIISATNERPVGLIWLSPSCTHFSRAKGAAPVSCKIRGLAWVGVDQLRETGADLMVLENVVEFADWGPLKKDGRPSIRFKGKTFKAFVTAIEELGYRVEYRFLRACDYGVPTIRKRMFLIAKKNNGEIFWPEPTHGPGLLPYRTAAECVDWSIPSESIFTRKKPLCENTMKRIAKGLKKYVLDAEDPYIVPDVHVRSMDGFSTETVDGFSSDIAPFITEQANGSSPRSMPIDEPLRTQCANVKGGHFALVEVKLAAFVAKHYGGPNGKQTPGSSLGDPLGTVTSVDHNGLVIATLLREFGTSSGADINAPVGTVMPNTKTKLVTAFFVKYYGTSVGASLNEPLHTMTTKGRFGLVTVHGEDYRIVDICMRMFQPKELFAAQGFPDDYIISPTMPNGKPMNKGDQVRMVGNSVPPAMAKAIVELNYEE